MEESSGNFWVSAIEWLRDSRFDEKVYGQPGKVILWLFVVLVWVYIVAWMYKDAEHRYFEGSRIKYMWLILGIIAAPIAWFVYLIMRPAADLDEAYLQRVEERYLSFEARGLGYCAKCGMPADPDHLYCTDCGEALRYRCKKCESIVEINYKHCPNCGTKVEKTEKKEKILSIDQDEEAMKLRMKRAGKSPEGKEKDKDSSESKGLLEQLSEAIGGWHGFIDRTKRRADIKKKVEKLKAFDKKKKESKGEQKSAAKEETKNKKSSEKDKGRREKGEEKKDKEEKETGGKSKNSKDSK